MVSFILPIRNGADTVEAVLRAVEQFESEPSELIVVDDASTDGTARLVEPYATRIISLQHPHGPAAARNLAVEAAHGDVLFFLDSDITPTAADIDRVVAATRDRPDHIGASTSSSPDPLNNGFYSSLCAIQEHFYQTECLTVVGPDAYPYIHTRFGTLRKDVFDRVGGFDATFTAPSIEDLDLSTRLADEGRFIFLPDVRIRHRWTAGFRPMWRRYFRNSFLWTSRVGGRTRKFDSAITTGRRATATLCAFAGLAAFPAAIVLPGHFRWTAAAAALSLLAVHGYLNIPQYRFFAKHKGMLFTLAAAMNVAVFSVPIILGAAAGTLAAVVKGAQTE